MQSRQLSSSFIDQLGVDLARCGYGVQAPFYFCSSDPACSGVSLLLRSRMGAGGFQDACVELTDDGICKLFAGQPYSSSVKSLSLRSRNSPWRRAELAATTPDLIQVILKKVRELLLAE